MKQLVIFDLDGTLLNTIDDLGEATNAALRQSGLPTHPIEAYKMMVGGGVRKLLERATPDENHSPETLDRLLESFKEYYNDHLADHTRPYDGIPELLQKLTDNGIKIAVASNKYQEATSKLIRHFFGSLPWVAIEGSKEGVPVKPDPSVVFEILSKSPTPKADVLYCGDSGVDMETAKRACVDVAGVTWGFRSLRELRAAGADVIVNDPAEIFALTAKDNVLI